MVLEMLLDCSQRSASGFLVVGFLGIFRIVRHVTIGSKALGLFYLTWNYIETENVSNANDIRSNKLDSNEGNMLINDDSADDAGHA